MLSKFLKTGTKIVPYGTIHSFKNGLGTEWIHIENEIRNNVFCVGLKTIGHSNGVAHILEHTTLCGSEAYPVRDPFFKMLNRSMATFMNAMTGDDLTMYPFSSQNIVDYYNLLYVYLDAVYKPILSEFDYMQEGWRLGPSGNLKNSPLVFKGVVYNEMKGVMADTSNLFMTRHQQALFKDSMYAQVSGGEPSEITNLTHDQLLSFHKSHYHPSNSIIYTFGSFELEKQMKVVEQKFQSFSRITTPVIKDVNPWKEHQKVSVTGPVDPLGDPEKQGRVAVSFLVNKSKEILESLTMSILSNLLLDGASSPMYKALIKSQLGSDFAPTTGYSPYTNTASLSFGLQGVDLNKIGLVQDTIMQVLQDSLKEGFSPSRISSVFHQIEIGLKHRRTQFGMNLGFSVVRNHVHSGDAMENLDFIKNLDLMKKIIKQDGFLESRLKFHLLENPHRLLFDMVPDNNYPENLATEEEQRLQKHLLKLSPKDELKIRKDNETLQKIQDSHQDPSCLPCLNVDQVTKEPTDYPILLLNGFKGPKTFIRETVTNGMSYVKFKFNVSKLDPSLIPYLPIFCRAMTSIGTKSKSLGEWDEAVRSVTGGISISSFSASTGNDIMAHETFIVASGNAANENISSLYQLLLETITEPNWTAHNDLSTCLSSEATEMANSCVDSGHSYAMKASAATFTPSSKNVELMSGISQIKFLDELVKQKDVEKLATKLKEISSCLFWNAPECLIITEKGPIQNEHQELLLKHFANYPVNPSLQVSPAENAIESISPNNPMNIGINFTSRSLLGVNYTHPDSPILKVSFSV